MALPKNVKIELSALEEACNEFVNSKLILIQKSISAILKTIAKGGQIYNVIAEEIVGYNFPAEFETALRSGSFDLILSEKKMVPFAFNLLNEMDNGNIDIFAFLKKMFGENSIEAYNQFSDVVIQSFVNGVSDLLEARFVEVQEDNAEEDEKAASNVLDEVFLDRIKYVIENIMSGLVDKKNAKLKEKADVNTICVSIILCIVNSEDIGLLGLVLGLRQYLKRIRYFKNDVKELDTIIKTFNEL